MEPCSIPCPILWLILRLLCSCSVQLHRVVDLLGLHGGTLANVRVNLIVDDLMLLFLLDLLLIAVVDLVMPGVHYPDLLRFVVLDLALLAVVGLALSDVHDLGILRHVILDLALLAVVGLVLPGVHVLLSFTTLLWLADLLLCTWGCVLLELV